MIIENCITILRYFSAFEKYNVAIRYAYLSSTNIICFITKQNETVFEEVVGEKKLANEVQYHMRPTFW